MDVACVYIHLKSRVQIVMLSYIKVKKIKKFLKYKSLDMLEVKIKLFIAHHISF